MRVAVVGAGVMGCAAARELARDGHEVLLYEQFDVGNERGSSHGRTRIVRLAYRELEWVRLAEGSFAGWRELEEEAGVTLLTLPGLVEFALDEEHGSIAALAAAGAEFERLTPDEVAVRWSLCCPDGWTAMYQPRAGVVRADLALRAFLAGALRHGTRLVTGTRVRCVDDLDAEVVVVTAGAWAARLVPDLPVRTTRETVVYFHRGGEPLPSLVHRDPAGDGRAMYSLWDPLHGLKAGAHHQGREVDADDESIGPDPALVERVIDWVAATHPDADPRPVATQTCMYTTTADEGFVVRRDGRVVVGSACSGHGFKFAPAIGRQLADLAGRYPAES
jgi:sarcosine oxidase